MKDENDVIVRMNEIIQDYHKLPAIDGHSLNEMLRQLTSCLYYLETVRSEAHNSFQVMIANLVQEGNSSHSLINPIQCWFIVSHFIAYSLLGSLVLVL